MRTKNVFYFPEGYEGGWLDLSYCYAQFNVGEKIVIEGEPNAFVVTEIQNQFRREDHGEAGKSLKMMMRLVFLELSQPYQPSPDSVTPNPETM